MRENIETSCKKRTESMEIQFRSSFCICGLHLETQVYTHTLILLIDNSSLSSRYFRHPRDRPLSLAVSCDSHCH